VFACRRPVCRLLSRCPCLVPRYPADARGHVVQHRLHHPPEARIPRAHTARRRSAAENVWPSERKEAAAPPPPRSLNAHRADRPAPSTLAYVASREQDRGGRGGSLDWDAKALGSSAEWRNVTAVESEEAAALARHRSARGRNPLLSIASVGAALPCCGAVAALPCRCCYSPMGTSPPLLSCSPVILSFGQKKGEPQQGRRGQPLEKASSATL
jgi:hypothetical protein